MAKLAITLQLCQRPSKALSCNFQKWNFVCDQKWKRLEDRAMEQNEGFGVGTGGMAEIMDVSVVA